MKLATYYQQEENTFCRLINLDETELSSYEKIYVFSESKDYITIPEPFRRAPNVIFGGTAFTNGKYVPFENKLIDYTLARPKIYTGFLKDKYQAGITEQEINKVLNNSYYRRFAGDEELPLPAILKRHRLYIYDRDFFKEDWRALIDNILARKPSSIFFIHPIHYHKISDFLDVRENTLIAKTNDAYLDLDIPLSETPALMKHYKNRLLAVINNSSQIYLSLGGSFHYRTEYFKNFIYKLNLLYIFWSQNIPIKLKYEEPALGCYNPISDISKLIALWSQGETRNYKMILDRVPKDKGLSNRRPEREQIEAIMKYYPSSKILFCQTFETVKKGGFWKYGNK